MDGSVLASWVGVGVLSVVAIGGWLVTYIKNSNTESKWTGIIETKVDGLSGSVDRLKDEVSAMRDDLGKRVGRLEGQVKSLADGYNRDDSR